ncbi:MAG: ATP-binding protein [Methanosarcinaceae archaeon]|nr:ATP-binding protein [Methanosarcinaceae archaeon]
MLIEINIENFRSIKEKTTLSMLAVKDKTFKDNLIDTEVLKNDSLLKSVAIYGANASGKTNVLMAFSLLKELVINSHSYQKGNLLPFTPFKLDSNYLIKPTIISIAFIKNNIKYNYGVSFDKEKIIDEYLYYYPKNHRKIIFERKNTNEYKFIYDNDLQKLIADRTLPNILYISKATQENYKVVSDAFDWFKDNLRFIGVIENSSLIEHTVKLLKDNSIKPLILKALSEADIGIDDVSVNVEKLKMKDLPDEMPSDLKKLIMSDKDEIELLKINTVHTGVYKGVQFDFEEESAGTQKLFSLIGVWIDALMNGKIIIVDELDVQLHPFLSNFLIKLFHNPTQNKKNAQLIFTTHDTNLLNIQEIFRRDQIYFTEKNYETGATDLYSLLEFRPRKDKNIENGYLAGRYGAIPFIQEGLIFEEELL